MAKYLKKTVIFSTVLLIVMFCNRCFALENIKSQGDDFLNQGSSESPISTDEAWEILRPIAVALVAIASVVLVIANMYMGIQYMITDHKGKDNIKQKLIGLIIATVLIYGGMGLFSIIINLFNSIFA